MSNLNTHENDELSRCELSGEDLDQASGGGAKDTGPKESISFNFTKIAWTYTAQDA
jgi:type VI protein secretion system component Hcp